MVGVGNGWGNRGCAGESWVVKWQDGMGGCCQQDCGDVR